MTNVDIPRFLSLVAAGAIALAIAANGEVYEHRAYALGIEGEEADELRQSLADFVAAATVEFLIGNPELGPEQPYSPCSRAPTSGSASRSSPCSPVTAADRLTPPVQWAGW